MGFTNIEEHLISLFARQVIPEIKLIKNSLTKLRIIKNILIFTTYDQNILIIY